jgi:hypothetical protein
VFDLLKRLYLENKINDLALENAILKNWITLEQKEQIINNK